MRPTLPCTESPAGLSRRVPSAVLVLVAMVMLAAGLARGQAPATRRSLARRPSRAPGICRGAA
jgi:hypothetical protein